MKENLSIKVYQFFQQLFDCNIESILINNVPQFFKIIPPIVTPYSIKALVLLSLNPLSPPQGHDDIYGRPF